MKGEPHKADQIREEIDKFRVQFVNLQFTDIVGSVKQVTIPASEWNVAVDHGVWFDGSSIEGFARIAESDMYLQPDLNTFSLIPWESEGLVTARCICDIYTPNGEPFEGDPRYALKRVMAQAEEMGFLYQTGPELEFFLFRQGENGLPTTKPHDFAGYFDVSTDLALTVRRQMVKALSGFGIAVEASHHEVAVGQHEIDFRYGPAVQTADNAVTLRITLKAIAQRNNLYCTFMPKPVANISGSGMHTNQSLVSVDSMKNAFADSEDEYGLSTIARQFIAGQIEHAKGMTAVIAPLVNSYKRLVPGFEAPVYISWARVNRSALIRIPRTSPGRFESTRVELRAPDPSSNPYLAFSVMLAAGLDGIKKQLSPPAPAEENLYEIDPCRNSLETLPGSLEEALNALEGDPVVQAALGNHIFERFLEAKRREWDDFRTSISHWELDRYLPVY